MTRKIGRYEILGPVGTGGMAEILLARLVGPSGFERPVVLKRIRPDLDHTELTSLFLEEARLAAKIRHANVVAVEDLGTDDGAPYLVMEYLQGESLSNVTRRLVSRDEGLPFGLAAYVIAEACAGLHAAHELRGADEQLVGLVHRDVSPQNVFVTYDGAVKVVDFGIARTDATPGQETTEAIRGKFGYIAPEQFNQEPLDRRTDIFALGVVFHELLTGHRLFKRFSQMATIRAVLTDPIVAPSRVEPTVPPALEAICMRALSRPRDERYATAAEMRRELLLAMRSLASEEPSAELAELMRHCFPDRIGEKRELLRSVREGSIVDHVPVGDIDVTIEIPALPVFDDSARLAAEPALPPSAPSVLISVPGTAPAPAPVAVAGPVLGPVPALAHTPLDGALPYSRAQATTAPVRRRRRRSWVLPLVSVGLLAGAGAAAALRFGGVARSFARNADTSVQASASSSASAPSLAEAAPSSRVSVTNASAGDEGTPTAAPPASAATPASAGPRASSAPFPHGARRPPRTSPAVASAPTNSPPPPPTSAPTQAPAAPSASTRGFRRFQ